MQVREDSQYPSVHWEKFFGKFPEIETLPTDKWKEVHLLSYFCRLYQSHYGVSYTFKFNSTAPYKSYEVFRLRSLMQMISSDPVILKDYIDWFFESKIRLKKKRITSLAFVVESNHATEYKQKRLAMGSGSVGRTTPLPFPYQAVVEASGIKCQTYGDLAFIKKEDSDEGNSLLSKLKQAGLDLTILERVS